MTSGMNEKQKFELEYVFKSSPGILYKLISTPDGLAEWFADNVNVHDDLYTFDWAGEEVSARLISSKSGEFMRWCWLEDEEAKTYFELRIKVDHMTKMVVFLVTDFAEADEVNEAKQLWETQIGNLMRIIGA
jgi:uncharacterized protein YndB with AHSA1/START domain